MQILLSNDDGIYAPGLVALERKLARIGDVCVVAPATEQSGSGHSITFLSPLIAKEVYDGSRKRGWAVEGTPADCVKLGVFEFCPQRPDLIVSGINGGLNAGINVLYSGTVAAAIEGAFFGITSVAVSLEYDERAQFDRAAEIAVSIIEQVLHQKPLPSALYNLNMPTRAMNHSAEVRYVPMGINRYGEHFVKRQDPKGRAYYWATGDSPSPRPTEHETDITALEKGCITLTPLDYDLTRKKALSTMATWDLKVPGRAGQEHQMGTTPRTTDKT